jgi:hypothetical protein
MIKATILELNERTSDDNDRAFHPFTMSFELVIRNLDGHFECTCGEMYRFGRSARQRFIALCHIDRRGHQEELCYDYLPDHRTRFRTPMRRSIVDLEGFGCVHGHERKKSGSVL